MEELESINDEIASNLMNAEFVETTSQQKDQAKSNNNNNESIISISTARRRRASPQDNNNRQVSQGNYANTSYSSFHSETFNPENNEQYYNQDNVINEETDTFTSISSSNV